MKGKHSWKTPQIHVYTVKTIIVNMLHNFYKGEKKEIDWSTVPKVPKHVTYLLIGGGVASLEAFIAIKTKDIKAKVSFCFETSLAVTCL